MRTKTIAMVSLFSLAAAWASISTAQHGVYRPKQDPAMYVGLDIGGFFNNTYDVSAPGISSNTPYVIDTIMLTSLSKSTTANVPSGLTVSGYAGYRFTHVWSIQFGYNWLQEQQLNGTMAGTASFPGGSSATISSQSGVLRLSAYNLYLAARAQVPLCGRFGIALLIGPAMTHLEQKVTFQTDSAYDHSNSGTFVSPMGAAALTYQLSRRLQVNLQYMYVSAYLGRVSPSSLKSTYQGTQRFTLGGTYWFDL